MRKKYFRLLNKVHIKGKAFHSKKVKWRLYTVLIQTKAMQPDCFLTEAEEANTSYP